VVVLISLPMAEAIRENSLLVPCLLLDGSSLCFASEPRAGMEDLLRIEWTQALNSFVRSCIGISENFGICSTNKRNYYCWNSSFGVSTFGGCVSTSPVLAFNTRGTRD
jgi:hypothetical protein